MDFQRNRAPLLKVLSPSSISPSETGCGMTLYRKRLREEALRIKQSQGEENVSLLAKKSRGKKKEKWGPTLGEKDLSKV